MVLLGDVDVVAPLFETDAHAGELRGDDAQVLERHILDRQLRTVHGGHADEAAHLDHVGQQRVFGAVQLPGSSRCSVPPNASTPSISSRFEAMPEIFAPILLSILHNCWR